MERRCDAGTEMLGGESVGELAGQLRAERERRAKEIPAGLWNAVKLLKENYEKGAADGHVGDPAAWALYQTWRAMDSAARKGGEGRGLVRELEERALATPPKCYKKWGDKAHGWIYCQPFSEWALLLRLAAIRIRELEERLAERPEVVRCKECRLCSEETTDSGRAVLWCAMHDEETEEVDYCSYGERK